VKLVRFLLLLFLPFVASADDFPSRPSTLVSDFAGLLSTEENALLEQKLVAFDDSTTSQIAVVIMKSVGNYDISDYTIQLFNRWKIGQEKKNNGVLLLIAVEDRKVFIATGYGVEGALPDITCHQIIQQDIAPNFKSQQYYQGIDAATNSILLAVHGDFKATDKVSKRKGSGLFPLFLVLLIIVLVLGSKAKTTSRYARMNNMGFWAAWALLNAAAHRNRGRWNHFSGGGGFGSSGGFGSGGSFGGFGGGMSGGGGAGGSW
jgi:uncharacterized protein